MWAHSRNVAGRRYALVDHLRSTGALYEGGKPSEPPASWILELRVQHICYCRGRALVSAGASGGRGMDADSG